MQTFVCSDCKRELEAFPPGGGPSNYYNRSSGKTCHRCTGNQIREAMERGESQGFWLYDDNKRSNVAKVGLDNESIEFPCVISRGGHNWRNVERINVWFRDHQGNPWFGVCYTGGSNMSLTVRRVKDTKNFPVAKPVAA